MIATAARGPSRPRRSQLSRGLAMRLAADEYDQFVAQARRLTPTDWKSPTDCPAWDVHAMTCHVLGLAEMAASPIEALRQLTAAKRAGGLFIDSLTDLQSAKHCHRTPQDLVAMLSATVPKAVLGRRRTPSLIRSRSMGDQPIDETGAESETWTLGYLVDTILTRDTWMHRSDIAKATAREMELTSQHDGVLVADVAAEWAGRHGQPCTLSLSGPAGGTWTFAGGGEALEVDTMEFCRVASGRGHGAGLLATRVPF